ncbi:hypothetical protein L1987_15149 [Smallanthus sonchifolius]|uniref:Uncharacterized protein n=1 Tax=Smallanthus sonchifolius TaxID=185202 RepID=A0ACB9J7C5_9ASTR|nr:hypothetical protein L1987_15149 [Smallanthus sonchifolius]
MDPVIPNSPREVVVEDASDSESTESDDNDPDASRIPIDKRPQPASYVSKRVKMVARKKRKNRTGPPPESSSKGKRLVDEDDDYNPDEDLDKTVSKSKKQRVSRPKFVTKSSRSLVQEGVNILNTIFSQATTTTTHVSISMSTPPGPIITSIQVTPDTQRLLDELIHIPPTVTSSSLSVIIPVSASNVSPPRSSRTTRSTSNFSREKDGNAHMVSNMVYLKSRVLSLENLVGAHGKDEHQIAPYMPSVSLAGKSNTKGESSEGKKGDGQQINEKVGEHVHKEILDCLINLDDVLIDDWESDAEDVEIEFKQDDEVVKYATYEGVEFDTSYIDQINNLAQNEIEAEEGEIVGEIEKESDSTEKVDNPSLDLSNMTWAEKKRFWSQTDHLCNLVIIFE